MIVLRTLTHLSPDAALLLFTGGLLLIYLELNRPGWIIPGAAGLLLTLLSVASLLRFPVRIPAVILLLTASAVFALNLLRRTHALIAALATFALTLSFLYLVPGPVALRIHPATAISCGLVLGAATSLLTAIARRARTSKRGRLI